ncbi:614/534 cytochrome P450 [Lactifluus volemus]|nr:614/534 cytochrome P450 [Lactifluus volemus]
MFTILSVFLSLLGLIFIQRFFELRRIARNVGNIPGPRYLFSVPSIPGRLMQRSLPPIPYLNAGEVWAFRRKYEDFASAGQDFISLITAFPRPECTILLADADMIKEVTTSRARFPKNLQLYGVLAIFGPNIVASEGHEWKRYRKIAAPPFSEKNNKLVWDETVNVMLDLFSNVWGDKPEVIVDHFLDITLPVSWTSDLVVPPGHQMTFKDAIHILSSNLIMKILLPDWAQGATAHTRKVHLAFTELKQYMLEMANDRRNGDMKEERYDLFSGLLNASQEEPESGPAINDQELMGNMFIFIIAGHETTAHALCFTFALLALYPDEQERLYQHIKGVLSSLNRMPTYEDMSRFTHSLAVLYETLRLFPSVPDIPKIAAEDTTLMASNRDGTKTSIPVPAGTTVSLHVPGIHYNPRYWKDPHMFKPERFLGDWPKDAFLPFNQGARACLGRRFAEIEGIAVITMLVSRYKIDIKEEHQFARETFEERYARVTAFNESLTLG